MVALALGIVGFAGYNLGTHNGNDSPHALTGLAIFSPYQAVVKVNGTAYGFPIGANDMQWYDTAGAFHDGGIPPCLQHAPGKTWLRFGNVNADGLDNTSWTVVTWVQCIAHP